MNGLDAGLLIALAVFGVAGFRRGFIVGASSFLGFLLGGALGMILVPLFLAGRVVTPTFAAFALVVVLAFASFGQVLASWLGTALRSRLRWRPARRADQAAGGILGMVAMLLVAWFLALAVVQGPFPVLTRQIHGSRVLATVDSVMPDSARELFASFRSAVDASVFPQVFGTLAPIRVTPVGTPDPAILRQAGVVRARHSIVEVDGVASSCREQITGSGFVVAKDRVVTNAHVVAGVRDPRVQVGGVGLGRAATVVYFDPKVDLAVLAVPGLSAPALPLQPKQLGPGADTVVIGFPEGGPYTAVPSRVRDVQRARGRDIYGAAAITREVYSLRTVVRPGNSGGPLLLPTGEVGGVVFAAAVDDPTTGYALTVAEVEPDIQAGIAATAPVSTGRCT